MRPLPSVAFLALLAVVAVVAFAGACGVQTREARAIQPNPIGALHSKDDLATSVPLYIYQKEVRLGPDYQLRNSAQFLVVDRDRLRFRVSLVAREESDADTARATVWLVDATGRRLEPEGRENGTMTRIAVNVRPYPYVPAGNRCATPPCFEILASGFEVYQGQSDYVFHADGIAQSKDGFTLVVEHQGVDFRYSWRFGDGELVENYGRTQTDVLHGVIELPGPQTQVVATRHEGEPW